MKTLNFLFISVLFFSCSQSKNQMVLDNDEMANAILQVHILEEKVKIANVHPYDDAQLVYDFFEKKLFDSLKITKEQYENSFSYYLDRPKKFNKVYAQVIKNLETSKNELAEDERTEIEKNTAP